MCRFQHEQLFPRRVVFALKRAEVPTPELMLPAWDETEIETPSLLEG